MQNSDLRAPLRTVTGRVSKNETRSYANGGGFWTIEITELQLDCGHTKTYRGQYVPKGRVRCTECPR